MRSPPFPSQIATMAESEPQGFDYLSEILTAPVYDVAVETPLQLGVNLSQRFNLKGATNGSSASRPEIKILYKREDLQPVFSFKIRGAYNKLRSLTQEQKECGVVAVSAGNHAQGVAMAAKKLGINATIVMPLNTPAIKWKNVERLGAKVILKGNDFDEAKVEGRRLVQENGMTDIPPFDDPYVIAGQGTIGVEILRQAGNLDDIEAIFCCCGGGGLVSGIASYVKRLKPSIKIFAVETTDSYALTHSLRTGSQSSLPQVGLFADGAAVCVVGAETLRIASSLLDGVILVTNDDICAAIKDVFEDTRSVVEPAGALSVAGLKRWLSLTRRCTIDPFPMEKGEVQTAFSRNSNGPFVYFPDTQVLLSSKFLQSWVSPLSLPTQSQKSTFVTILSGANMNFDRLRFVADRADLGLKKEALISVTLPESPGSFINLHKMILPRNVTSFSYRYSDSKDGRVMLAFSLINPEDRDCELAELFSKMESQSGFKNMTDLSDNELAKSHARFLVGGRSSVPNERLFRFEFPERPNALGAFLSGLNISWNVSLFQYRNYGGDTGKVLVGIQVPPEDNSAMETFLRKLNYPWIEETDNPVYKNFLCN
ncbi:threonine deaminase [Entomophthora muscae]|uniref:Threonine deaminase n=1 Tax=Entomophthora muscae TaxID=34485 RepID=A0ACC2URH7_9FUNG|nr:threonine deaminase [Entomophthora muscae]